MVTVFRFRVPRGVPGDVPHVGGAARAGGAAGAARAPPPRAHARAALHAQPAHARRRGPHVSITLFFSLPTSFSFK